MSEDRLTWYAVANEIDDTVRQDVADGTVDLDDEEACDTYAWEYADGTQYVIYTHMSRTLWADGLPDWAEDEAKDCGPYEDPDGWITAAVFFAIRGTIMQRLDEIRDEREEGE